MKSGKHILWDTCVLYRWLTGFPVEYVDHINRFVADAKSGDVDIYLSSIALAEIRPSIIKHPDETPAGLISKLCSFLKVVDTVPDIMSLAGLLRDNTYICATDHPNAPERKRELSTGDAIQLATAIWMKEYAGVQNFEFHTFDDGKGRNSVEGRAVPMLSYHNWCKGLDDIECVQLAKELKRQKPSHPLCALPVKLEQSRRPAE